ncbi:hypothetical protein [Maricaulis sp.]|uniref:hypothetical protein n=1 Tax=Maricaulis sp. TaxID=1486257 RepID=UPI003A91723F
MNDNLESIIDSCVSVYSVGFIRINDSDPTPLGSGTLVSCPTIQGILTCGHVLAELPIDGAFGIAQFGRTADPDQRIQLSGKDTAAHAVKFYEKTCREGPDLAFIPIPVEQFAALKASSSVVDLERGKRMAVQRPEAETRPLEVVAGVVGEMTQPAIAEGIKRTLTIKGLACPGSIVAAPHVGQWDQLHFKPQQQPDSSVPTDFKGTSGGGIWRVRLRGDADENFTVADSWLAGVAYWQDEIESSLGIIGHGPISVYGHLLAALYRRWPPK